MEPKQPTMAELYGGASEDEDVLTEAEKEELMAESEQENATR